MQETETRELGIARTVPYTVDEAIPRITESLKGQGFGVLTEINVTGTLKEKLNLDFRRYHILGACNPPFAHRALEADPLVGLLLPCNVIVYETDEGETRIAAFDPRAMLQAFNHPELSGLAAEIGARLQSAIDAV